MDREKRPDGGALGGFRRVDGGGGGGEVEEGGGGVSAVHGGDHQQSAGGGFFGDPATWGNGRGQERERVIPEILSTREAQHFALSLPVGATTIGCHDSEHVRENITNARSYSGITRTEYHELIERVTEVALNNTLEHYKDQA